VARLDQLRRIAANQVATAYPADQALALPLLKCTDGRFAEAERTIVDLLTNNLAVCEAHTETFISFLHACFVVQRFDLVAALLHLRYGYGRELEIAATRDGPGLGRVRWEIQATGAHRFTFDAMAYRNDNTRVEILAFQWAFPLYSNYSRLAKQETGTIVTNQGDVGQTPGLAWNDNRPDYFLVPDCLFVPTHGYRDARRVLHERSPRWADRRPMALWRGGTTGIPRTPGDWRSLERIRLCELARTHEHTGLIDAGISSIVQMDDPDVVRQIQESGLVRGPIPWEDWGGYKYQIDIDGNSSPWSNLFQRLLTGGTVLKVESARGLRQWYYDELSPWRNYVPVAPDMSDLMDKISWLARNDAAARRIGEAGLALAGHLTYEREIARSTSVISAAFRYFNGGTETIGPFGICDDTAPASHPSPPDASSDGGAEGPECLDTTGILSGTDKSSLGWDYLRHYEVFFEPWQNREFNLIEIGVGGGNSMLTWQSFFTKAAIVGVDIMEGARRCAGGRVHIEIGSQADPEFLDKVLDRFPPEIVIDDGSHQAEHIMFTFRHVFPRLAPGGWYVIEDLNITGNMEGVPLTPHAFFAHTAEALMLRRPGDHPDPGLLSEIDRIDIVPGLVFVRKRDQAALLKRRDQLPAIVERTSFPNNFHWLREVLMREPADLQGAEIAGRRAAAMHPAVAIYHLGLSIILERTGDMAGAIEAARESAVREPDQFSGHLRLAELLALSGDPAAAATAMDRAAATAPAVLRGFIDGERQRLLGSPP